VPIGIVQGVVADTDSGNRHVSPLGDQMVTIRGVIADWPADDPDDGPRGTSDHDPPRALFALWTRGIEQPNTGTK
jgi:hypothetical protein